MLRGEKIVAMEAEDNCNGLNGRHHRSRIIRASGGNDRHSKVWTSKGLRDRRIRLSELTAVQLFDLQDRLGFHQPSEAVEWLITQAADAVAELPSLNTSFLDDAPSQHGGFDYERAAKKEEEENNNCIDDEFNSRTGSITELLSGEYDFFYKAKQEMEYYYESSLLGIPSTAPARSYHHGGGSPPEIQRYFSFVPEGNQVPAGVANGGDYYSNLSFSMSMSSSHGSLAGFNGGP